MRDELLLKARLLVNGIRIDQPAMEGVGEVYKEQAHHLFEYDFDLHKEGLCPADMRLPKGTVVQVRLSHHSPFIVRRCGDTLVLVEGEREISQLQWLERPAFYSLNTSEGKPMKSVAELIGEDCIAVCHTNSCLTFANGKQCAFCNLNYTPKQYDEVRIRKRATEVAEVVGAAFKEGVAHHFEITGGILPGNQEVEILETYLNSFREVTGLSSLPGCMIMTPPRDFKELERLQRTGVQAIGFNLECFNPAFFRAVCPGKEERFGYERYREALRASVEIFGAGGNVFSGFVAGIEPMEYLLEGVQELAEEGVASIPLIWSPSAGTRFHGHRSPTPEWYLEMSEKATTLMIRHLKRDPNAPRRKTVRCVGCQNQVLLQDFVQSRLSIFKPCPAEPAVTS